MYRYAQPLTWQPFAHGQLATSRASFGWTAPTVSYDDMRAIKVDADNLAALVSVNVADPGFRSQWAAWYANWNAFYDKYQDIWAKLGAATYSDDLANRVKQYSLELQQLSSQYNQQRNAAGGAVPQVPAPVSHDPQSEARDSGADTTSAIKWIVGGTVLVSGVVLAIVYAPEIKLAVKGLGKLF